MQRPKKHIFICTSSRPTGQQKGFCHTKAGVEVMARMNEEIAERELGNEVFVTNTGCFGVCEKGPIVVVYPDNVWYGPVSADDVPAIVEEHIEGGRPVDRLVLK